MINGKIYIGQHRVANENDNDDYLGSGKLIRRAVKLYGKDNFKKEIIAYRNSLDELNQLEEEYIKMYNSTNHTIGYNISKVVDLWNVLVKTTHFMASTIPMP